MEPVENLIYYLARERQEVACANRARNESARIAHLELARLHHIKAVDERFFAELNKANNPADLIRVRHPA